MNVPTRGDQPSGGGATPPYPPRPPCSFMAAMLSAAIVLLVIQLSYSPITCLSGMDQPVPNLKPVFCLYVQPPNICAWLTSVKWCARAPGGSIERRAAASLMDVLDRYTTEYTVLIDCMDSLYGGDGHTGRARGPTCHLYMPDKVCLLCCCW